MDINEVVIIGAGPAGIAAAIQLSRYNIKPVLLEKNEIGGLLKNASLVENYPGFSDGISGIELVGLFKKHLINAGVEVDFEEVKNVDYDNDLFFIETNKRTIKSKFLIIASGTEPEKLSDIVISEECNDKIFYEPYPELMDVKDKKIIIIGAGDAAFDYAINLSKHNRILILNRSNKLKCLPILWERCVQNKNISYRENIKVKEIDHIRDGLILKCCGDENEEIYADFLIAAIGRKPDLKFLSDNLKKNYGPDILVTSNKNSKMGSGVGAKPLHISNPLPLREGGRGIGVENHVLYDKNLLFIIGDVNNNIYRQTAICAGDGIKAAMQIYLRRE